MYWFCENCLSSVKFWQTYTVVLSAFNSNQQQKGCSASACIFVLRLTLNVQQLDCFWVLTCTEMGKYSMKTIWPSPLNFKHRYWQTMKDQRYAKSAILFLSSLNNKCIIICSWPPLLWSYCNQTKQFNIDRYIINPKLDEIGSWTKWSKSSRKYFAPSWASVSIGTRIPIYSSPIYQN